MGNCDCVQNEENELPEMALKMAHTKYSMESSNMFQPPKMSKMLSSSTVYSHIFKIASQQDDNITSRVVRQRQKQLPLSQAAQFRDLVIPEEQSYIENLSAKYIGEKYDGKPNGFGKLYFDNDDYLEGIFVNGRCEGKGRFIKADGSYYEGDIRNNVADGHGVFIDRKGFKYEGQWKNNMPNGLGEAMYPDETRYAGEFLNNKKHGRGTLFQGGNIYRGTFKNDQFDGRVEYIAQNGQQFKGQWKNNLKNGYGIYKWPDGSQYEGNYFEGQRNGFGFMIYSNGDEYEGQWEDGKKHGEGKFKSTNQNIKGVWKKGKLMELTKE